MRVLEHYKYWSNRPLSAVIICLASVKIVWYDKTWWKEGEWGGDRQGTGKLGFWGLLAVKDKNCFKYRYMLLNNVSLLVPLLSAVEVSVVWMRRNWSLSWRRCVKRNSRTSGRRWAVYWRRRDQAVPSSWPLRQLDSTPSSMTWGNRLSTTATSFVRVARISTRTKVKTNITHQQRFSHVCLSFNVFFCKTVKLYILFINQHFLFSVYFSVYRPLCVFFFSVDLP